VEQPKRKKTRTIEAHVHDPSEPADHQVGSAQRRMLGSYGHPIGATPNLDRLAIRGALFESAYTPCPVCVPARVAFATGKYVHQIGTWDNAMAYDGRVPSGITCCVIAVTAWSRRQAALPQQG
jgi:hypothetical protein